MGNATAHFLSNGLGLGDRISAMISTFKAGVERRRAYRQTVAELRSLSDLDLADLGFCRCDIPRIALDAANSK